MREVYNFSAGPSMLSDEVLASVQRDLLNYNGSGMSVMEMSHRGKTYMEINAEAESLLRELMEIPENYDVIFVQGGASTQFAAIPLNLTKNGKADYLVTGNFASKAREEAALYTDVKIVASSKAANYTFIPKTTAADFRTDADYVHITSNNTIFGTHFTDDTLPETGNVPLVTDASSHILGEYIDVKKFGVVYAGAQKNIGPAGVTIVIARHDLTENPMKICPTMLKWNTQIAEHSLYNTPPAFSTYVSMLTFRWLKKIGGVETMQKINVEKARMLYDLVDNSTFYRNPVNPTDRSIMNVPFITPNADLDAKFCDEASKLGMKSLKGHRLVGGMRASIYNAMPIEGVEKLAGFMKKFELENK